MSGGSSVLNNTRLRRKIIPEVPQADRKEKNVSIKKVSVILKKREDERTSEENELLFQSGEIAKEAASRLKKRELLKQREVEFEDNEEELDEKCARLAEAVSGANYLVVYTGAGISTAARIPDYRGTSGIWTLLQQGKDIGEHDLTQAEPTYTHMALAELHHRGRIKHVVSQNCDGLHLRSGMPRTALSEVHGNMYIEVCRSCRPYREYLRLFDVTESTARFSHRTQRRCYRCGSPLTDCIVHFGERGNLPWPLNWKGACRAAEEADVILCLGSSLKVLKKYPWLWSMDKPAKRRPKLFIVNLQWTPKDCHAVIKIHGKCDAVMKRVAKFLNLQVPEYKKERDPIFVHATGLCEVEEHTTTRRALPSPPPSTSDAKDDVIVITVESDSPACCDTFKRHETHEDSCVNSQEASSVPVIMAPLLMPDLLPPELMAPSPLFPTIMEAMFFNYLYTLVSYSSYQNATPIEDAPTPSTSYNNDEPLVKRLKVEPSDAVKCSFCSRQYGAGSCLFYVKYDAEFKENAKFCLCCGDDDSDSEFEAEDNKPLLVREVEDAKEEPKEESSDGMVDSRDNKTEKEVKEEPKEESCDGMAESKDNKTEKDGEKKGSVNPGWYGRGYRKKLKKKR